MRETLLPSICVATLLLGPSLRVQARENPAPSSVSTAANASTPAGDSAKAADAFVSTLDEAQRGKLLFDFADEAQRKRWSNLPSGIYARAGLRLADLSPAQKEAAMRVLTAALSPAGYEKVQQIMQGDEMLEKPSGGRIAFGKDEYFISFLGKPSATEPWMIQFGGHHLALNITLAGANGTLAPSHTAAQPARYEFEGKTVRPLGRETDKSFELMSSLDEGQRKQAILGFQMRDLALGPGRDGQTIQPEGIKGSALNEQQRKMLLDLANEWTGIAPEALGQTKLEEMRKNIEETWFAWSGPTEKGAAAYFRIQGPTVHIEYAPQRMGGDATQHIHTIYRDPTNEYGAQWWKRP